MTVLEDWPTYEEVATALMRKPKTLQNLVSKYALDRRVIWIGRGRRRRRLTRLSPEAVKRLARLTGQGFLIRP